MAILRRQRPETVSKVRAGIERRLSNNRHARCKVGATVVQGATPDRKRRVRKSSRTATRIGRGPPAGVSRCSASVGAVHSSSTVTSRPALIASQTRKSGCSAIPTPASSEAPKASALLALSAH